MLYIDSREPDHLQNTVAAAADKKNVETTVEELKTGDFVIGETAIERKEAGDLNSSIPDQRIFEQTTRMAKDFEKCFVIVEGDPYQESRGPTNSSIAATLASISFKKEMHIIYTPDHVQTAKVIAKLAEYSESGEEFDVDDIKLNRTDVDTESLVVHTLAGVQGISVPKARVIEAELVDTVEDLLELEIDDLETVEGIGPTLAKRIYKKLRDQNFDG